MPKGTFGLFLVLAQTDAEHKLKEYNINNGRLASTLVCFAIKFEFNIFRSKIVFSEEPGSYFIGYNNEDEIFVVPEYKDAPINLSNI